MAEPYKVRPIGEKFQAVTPPRDTMLMNRIRQAVMSNESDGFSLWTYVVTDHVEMEGGQIAEAIRAVDRKIYPPKGWTLFRGFISAIPPDHLLPLLSDDWREPIIVVTYDTAESEEAGVCDNVRITK